MFLFITGFFAVILGIACPPLLPLSAYVIYRITRTVRSGVKAIRADEQARIDAIVAKRRAQAIRYFTTA